MKPRAPRHFVLAIGAALLAGTFAGKRLFPKPPVEPPRKDREGAGASPRSVSALHADGGLGFTPAQVFHDLAEGRSSSNPGRSALQIRLRLHAMSDPEILQLAAGLVADEFALTEYESYVLTTVWNRYATIDPQAAHRDALRLRTRILRRAAARIAARAWATADPAAALAAFIDAEKDNPEISSLGMALRALVETDPARAIAVLDAHRHESWYAQARGSLFQRWSTIDKQAAREWLVNGMRDDDPESAGRILLDLAAQEPADALALALDMEPDGSLRRSVGEILSGHWMWTDRKAALAALEKLPEAWHSRGLAENFGRNSVVNTPLAQLDTMAALFPAGDLRRRFWRAALGRRASDSRFDEAIALLEKLPPGETRGDGAAELASSWARQNPADASEWLSTLAPGIERDDAVGAFARTIAPLDPESARRWVESIDDEQRRIQVLERLP